MSPSRRHKKTPQQFSNAAAHIVQKPSLRKPSLNERMETNKKRLLEGPLDQRRGSKFKHGSLQGNPGKHASIIEKYKMKALRK